MPELFFLFWGRSSWERVNTYAPSRTNCLIQEGKKKILLENWMVVDYSPSDLWISVCGEGIQVEKNVISLYLRAVLALSHHLNYRSLYHKHQMMCVLLPTSLKPITIFFLLNIWELFRIKIHLHQHWLNQLSYPSLTQTLAIEFFKTRRTLKYYLLFYSLTIKK